MNDTILDQPPVSFLQVLVWAEDAGCAIDNTAFASARLLPETTPLRAILAHLGATPRQIEAATARIDAGIGSMTPAGPTPLTPNGCLTCEEEADF